MQPGAAKPARSKTVLIDTGHYTGMVAIKLLDLVLVLPADFALSLTKGFHNAPKLYHDSTVREIPTVRSIRSGVRVAGTVFIPVQKSFESYDLLTFSKEFTQEFYDGVTGLILQPVHAVRQSGGKALIPGIGKGLGGAFFKPLTGRCCNFSIPRGAINNVWLRRYLRSCRLSS